MESIEVAILNEAEWEADEVSFCSACICLCVQVTDCDW